jgi:Zn-dependent protease with chaperone function
MRNANWTIFICAGLLILGWFLPVQIHPKAIELLLLSLVLMVLCITICWKILRIMELRGINLVVRVLLTLFLAFALVCISGLFLFGESMCGYSSDRVLLQNKTIPNLYIVERTYGCGVYDSQSPKYETFKVRQMGSWISYISKTDTATLNKNDWTPVLSK